MTDQEILDALGTEPFEPNPVSTGYLVGSVLNALAMVLLYTAYLGFIAAIGYLLYYHLADYSYWSNVNNAPGLILGVLLQTTILLACVILILFLLKPIFIRYKETELSQNLDPEEEALLFSFATRLAALMNVPPPQQIRMIEDVNAVVTIERNGKFPFGKGQRALGIGLPLFYNLSLSQFSGVLAHELGHFSQHPLRFFPRVVNSIYEWFHQALNQRETWAKFLAKAGQNHGCGVGIVALAAQLVIWLACGVLWLFLKLAQLSSFVLLRQMEYDADRWHARVCGCDDFQAGHEKMAVMKFFLDLMADRIKPYVDDGILIDNVPRFVAEEAERFASEKRATLLKTILPKHVFLDVHPSIAARIDVAQKNLGAGYQGRVQLEMPASRLLRNLESTSKDFTKELYQGLLGEEITDFEFRTTEEIFVREDSLSQAARNWADFSLGQYQPVRFLPFDVTILQDSDRLEDADSALKKSREIIASTYAAQLEFMQEYDDNDDQWNQAFYVQNLYAASVAFKGQIGSYQVQTAQDAKAVEEAALAERAKLDEKLLPFETTLKDRLAAAFSTLDDPCVTNELSQLLKTYHTLAKNQESTLALRNRLNAILGFLGMRFICSSPKKFRQRTQWFEDDSRRVLGTLLDELQDLPYPFADQKETSFLAWASVENLPQAGNIIPLMKIMGRFLTAENDLRLLVLGRLAEIAMQVEESLGMPSMQQKTEK